MAGKNLLVNGKNNITARANAMADIQNTMANRTTATNVNTTPNLPTRPTTVNLQKAQQPVQTKLNNLNTATGIISNNPAFNNWALVNQNNQSRFIWFQQPKTDLWGNLTQEGIKSIQPKWKSVSSLMKPTIYIPTAQKEIDSQNKQYEKEYKENENLIKQLHWDIKNANWQLTKEDITKKYKQWKGKEDAVLELQADLRPLIQQGQYGNMQDIQQYYSDLFAPKKKSDESKLKEQEEESKKLSDAKKRADKLLNSNNSLSQFGTKYLQDVSEVVGYLDYIKKNYRLPNNPSDSDILNWGRENIPELKNLLDDMQQLESYGWMTNADWDTIFNNGFDFVEWLGDATNWLQWASDYVKDNPLTNSIKDNVESGKRSRQLQNLWINGWAANTITQWIWLGTEKAAQVTSIVPDMLWGITWWINKVWTSLERIAKQQNLTDEWKTDWSWVVQDTIKLWWGALSTAFNTLYAPYTALFNLAWTTDIWKTITEYPIELVSDWWKNLLDWTLEQTLWWDGDNMVTRWFNSLDKEAQSDLLNELTYALFKKWGKVAKTAKLEWSVLVDAVSNALKEWKNAAKFQTWVEKWMANENWKFQKWAVKRIANEWISEFSTALKRNFRLFDTAVKNYKGDITSNMNTLPDNRTFREKAESKYNQAKDTVNEWINTAKEWVNNVVDAARETVSDIKDTVTNIKNKAGAVLDKWFDKMDNSIEKWIDKIKNRATSKGTEIKEAESNWWWSNNKWVISKVVWWATKVWSKIYDTVVEPVATKWAEIITSTTNAQDKLFKAVSPTLNKLTNKRWNYEQKRQNADRTNELIVEYWHQPENTTEYYNALIRTKQDLWKNEVQRGLDEHKYTTVNVKDIIQAVREEMSDDSKYPLETNKSDLALLEKEFNNLIDLADEDWNITLEILEAIKQQINAKVNYWKNPTAWEVYEKWLRELNKKISEIEDQMISELPWEFTKFKKDYGALKDMEEDVLKMMLKDMKKKDWWWLIQNRWRIEGLGKLTSKPIEWILQFFLWESLGKAKDVNFNIKTWFEQLKNQYKGKKKTLNVKGKDEWETKSETPKKPTPKTPTETPKNKVTSKPKKSTKTVDKKESNQYNTTDASSNTSSVNLSQKEEAATWTKSSSSWATPQGWNLVWPTTAFSNKLKEVRDAKEENWVVYIEWEKWRIYNRNDNPKVKDRTWKQHQFTNTYVFDIPKEYSQYLDNLNKFLTSNDSETQISDKYSITRDVISHIFKEHWLFAPENLIATLNLYDDIVYNPKWHEDVTYLLKKIPWSKNFFRATVWENWVVTFFERVSWWADLYSKDLAKWQQEKGGENSHPPLSEDSITKKSENASKNAITSKKSAVTAPKQEENQTSDHFSYDEYGKFMDKVNAAEKEISDRLDKQYDKERAEKMERFNELTKKEDKTDAEWNEMMKLANELNNMRNKYDRLKEEEFNKKYPDLVKEKQRQNEMFDRDWKAAMDKKYAEMEKPFNELRDKYLKEVRDEFWVADDVTLDSNFYNSLTPEQKKIADEINNEYAEKYEGLRQKMAGVKKIEEESKAKITSKKNKVTNPSKVKETGLFSESEVDKGKKSEWLNPDALPLSDYREMQRLGAGSYNSLVTAIRRWGLKDYMSIKIANELVWNYAEIYADESEKWVERDNDWHDKSWLVEDMYDAYEEWDLKTANGYANDLVKWKTAKELIDEYKPQYKADIEAYNKLVRKYWPNFDDWKIDLTWAEGRARREFANQENETAQDIDYQELTERENETAQDTKAMEEEIEYLDNILQNETPQTTEEELSKNKVTAKTPEKPKNLVTNSEFQTLPEDVSVWKEQKKTWPKRIAPDRISWQQLNYEDWAKRIMEDIKKIARHIELQREMKKPMASRTDTRPLAEINSELLQTGREVWSILWKNWLYKSTRSQEFKDLWRAIANANNDPSTLAQIWKDFYEKKVKQDLSKWYVYPDGVLDKIPWAKKAANARERYQKGLDTSFSAKDERIDYSAKDKIGGGMKRQDWKQLTEEQKNEIVKWVMDFQKVFGINMKKMAEDLWIVYVHINGKKVFMSKASGMFKREYNDDWTIKNASISVWWVETVRWKDEETWEWKTEEVNTIMSHELGHVVDYLVDRNLIVGGDLIDLKYSYKRPQNNHSWYAGYLRRDTEVVARAFEQYMAVEKWGWESYYDKVGYWGKDKFENYVKPILEKAIKDKLWDWYINPDNVKYQKTNVLSNGKNKVTNWENKADTKLKNQIKKDMEQLMKTWLIKWYQFVKSTKDLYNLINGTTTQPKFQSVRHGSPAAFEKFDSTHMGEWEWAQAHGWWHYVAVEERTWRHYAELNYVWREDVTYKWKKQEELYWINAWPNEIAASNVMNRLQNTKVTFKEAIENSKEYDNDTVSFLKRIIDNKEWVDHWYKSLEQVESLYDRTTKTIKAYDELKKSDFSKVKQSRNLYSVEIPDPVKKDTPTGSNYLEEWKKLTEKQWNKFREELRKVDDSKKYKMSDWTPVKTIDWYYPWQSDTHRLYRQLSQILWSDKAASKFLESLWYDGIHYFWWQDWEAYVIFNDDALDITNHIQYLKDNQGNVAWATLPDWTIVFVEDALRSDTAFHETSHRLVSFAKENDPNLYNSVVKIAEEAPQELKDYVKETYWDLSPEAFIDEVFAWQQGKYSAIKWAETWYQRMWNAIKKLWNNIRSKFWKEYADLSVFEWWEKMNSEQLMKEVDKLLKWWKEIWKWKGNLNYEIVDQTNTPEFKKWFKWSKVVNEDGSPKIMYHWTPSKWFTVFKEWYFTENKEYADKYQNPNASSIRFNKKADNPWTYAVYLSIKNPFDTRDPKAKKIFEEEYFGNYWMWTPLWEKGLPDWMDGNELQEFIMEAHPEYDGLILDEWGIWWYWEEVIDRWVSYVPFEPNQIKSATDNIWTFDKNNPDIRYQKNILANWKNKITTQAARASRPQIVMRLDEDGNPIKKKTKNLVWNEKNKVTTNAEAIRNPVIQWKPRNESTNRINQTYDRLKNSLSNAEKYRDYEAQYHIIEQMNGLAHRIAKKTWDKEIEKATYPLKNKFAKDEIDRRWADIIKRDDNKKMYYLTRPDWSKSYHVSHDVWRYAKKKRGK